MKYAMWNNKGGVGKTFLTFVLATEHALTNPNKTVCVVDMCPQANISEILLGGSRDGYGVLKSMLEKDDRTTIGGYFDKRLSSPDARTGNERTYAVKCRPHAPNLPENLYLVVGDPSLELQVQSINQIASVDLPEERWGNVHKWLDDLQDGISGDFENSVDFFIDCNPSFATYTAQSIVAAERVIAPCTADGSSARAIENIGHLLYGVGTKRYAKTTFASKAQNEGINMPLLFSIVMNRHTTNRERPSSAFGAMYEEIKRRADTIPNSHFVPGADRFPAVPDAHAVAIVSCEKAIPVTGLRAKQYELQHGKTMVNADPLQRYQEAIAKLVKSL